MKLDRPIIFVDTKEIPMYSWKATRLNDGLEISAEEIGFVEFHESGQAKEIHKEPKVGLSFIMSPFGPSYTWMTTLITELIEVKEDFIHFKTQNSEYKVNKLK